MSSLPIAAAFAKDRVAEQFAAAARRAPRPVASGAGPRAPVSDPRRWKALALLCTAFFMVILDSAIVVVALPSIDADLGFSAGDLQWVLSAYLLSFGGLLLLGGRAADLLGRRRMFIAGPACSRWPRSAPGWRARPRRCSARAPCRASPRRS